MERIIGSNKHGFSNEEQIRNALNNKKISNLNINLKKFIEYVCKSEGIEYNPDIVITAENIPNSFKSDINININNNIVGISIKMGSRNSVHQEKIDGFIEWASDNTDINEKEKEHLLFMIWADGSLDGTSEIIRMEDGKIKGRFGNEDFSNKYFDKLKVLNNFFNRNRRKILERVLFEGKLKENAASYIYKGTVNHGSWISKSDFLKYYLIDNTLANTPKCGPLSYQSYNPDLKGTVSGAGKRGSIQFKYSALEKDLDDYYCRFYITGNIGTREGDHEEFNLTKYMNINLKHKYWKTLNINTLDGNYYLISVIGNKYSKLIGKKVKCKTDNYVIKTENPIDRDLLLSKEFLLTERDLPLIKDYKVIEGTGISVKRQDSQKFTITKISKNSFIKAFNGVIDKPEFVFAGSMFYHSHKKVGENEKLANQLGILSELNAFYNYFSNKVDSVKYDIQDVNYIKKINKVSKLIIYEAIENNSDLKESLFTGKHYFESPYFINYVLKYGDLSKEVFMPYYVDNGSGRSSGNFNIILKPK